MGAFWPKTCSKPETPGGGNQAFVVYHNSETQILGNRPSDCEIEKCSLRIVEAYLKTNRLKTIETSSIKQKQWYITITKLNKEWLIVGGDSGAHRFSVFLKPFRGFQDHLWTGDHRKPRIEQLVHQRSGCSGVDDVFGAPNHGSE